MGVGTLRLSRRAHFFFLLDLLLVSWTCLGRSWNGRLPPRGGGGRERGKRNGTEDGAAGEGSGLVSLFFMLLSSRSTTRSPRRDLISMLQRPFDPDSQYL